MTREGFDAADFIEDGDYVVAVYAGSLSEAERCCQLLEDHDIPAMLDEDCQGCPKPVPRKGIPVLVPRPMLDDVLAYLAELEDIAGVSEDDDIIDDDEDDEAEEEDEDDPADRDEGFEIDLADDDDYF